MKWLIIGHRGVGKSELLKRFRIYLSNPTIQFIDLDRHIELEYKKSIFDLFPQIGEAQFRKIEETVFKKLHSQNQNYVICAGAGFPLQAVADVLTNEVEVIWIKRHTDDSGRIFFDRPRLNAKTSALNEYLEKLEPRKSLYQTFANRIYLMPEGLESPSEIEKKILLQENLKAGGILTLMPMHLKSDPLLFLNYGCDYYEIRDDIVSIEDGAWKKIPQNKRLFSFRLKDRYEKHLKFIPESAQTDWASELGPCPSPHISIISSHNRIENESVVEFLSRLEASASKNQLLKASPEIKNYSELEVLFNWQRLEPDRRSILPRSTVAGFGRWMWARLYNKGRQKINFWRDSNGSSFDQPTLFEWLSSPSQPKYFAGLIGNPVVHSKTIIEQSDFFHHLNQPVWPILLEENEFDEALKFLQKMGLSAAAVTSPFKKQAALISQVKSPEALELDSVNTLAIQEQKIHGHNTDLIGFRKLIDKACDFLKKSDSQITAVIWGGGGTLPVIQKILKQALPISVRSQKPRDENQKIPQKVDLLIWAAGTEDDFPLNLEFELIVDLNYREDSRARELSLITQKKYLSGSLMFKTQAAGQRDFWKTSPNRLGIRHR